MTRCPNQSCWSMKPQRAFFGVAPTRLGVESALPEILLSTVEAAPAPWMTVVGVVGNAKLSSLDEIEVPHIYESMYQRSRRDFGVLVRAIGDKAALTRDVRREIQTVDPDLPVSDMTAMTDLISNGVGDRRFAAWLLGSLRAGSVASYMCGCLRHCLLCRGAP